MKTIRTVIATLSVVLLAFALGAWISVRRNAAFIQRTIYQGFDQTFVVALVMGCAFLLIAIILTVAIVSTDEDEEDEEPIRPRKRPQALPAGEKRTSSEKRIAAEKRAALPAGEQPYRRVSRSRTMDQPKDGFARPQGEAPRKREKGDERPERIPIRGDQVPVKKKVRKPEPEKEQLEESMAPEAAWKALSEEKPKAPEEAPKAPEKAPEAIELGPIPEAEVPAEAPAEAPTAAQEAPETAPEVPEKAPETESEPAPAPKKEEGTVRCIFCGTVMGREEQVCPNCGKKR